MYSRGNGSSKSKNRSGTSKSGTSRKKSSTGSKKKNKIYIKPENRGKFTEYCGGKVTSECIARGKRSKDPAVRKRATFAQNSRKWNKGK